MSTPPEHECWQWVRQTLDSIDAQGLLRHDAASDFAQPGTSVQRHIGGAPVVNFCSNDYLDLSRHPHVVEAARAAADRYGTGATASRLVYGTLPVHHELEHALAQFKGTPAALLFSSGYMACVGVVRALLHAAPAATPVYFDRLSHASLIDASTQNNRHWRSFAHNSIAALEALLSKRPATAWPSAIVVTEGVFSMDGDVAPLREISELCARHHAILVVDDAHGTGVTGPGGRGTATLAGIAAHPHLVQIGTLSKALGSQGGFVACSAIVRQLLLNAARTMIFDTGLNPVSAAAVLAALQQLQSQPDLHRRLTENITLFRRLIRRDADPVPTPIVPIILGEPAHALHAAAALLQRGLLVSAIRPPTVPPGTSRLRVTITAGHTHTQLRTLAEAITESITINN